MLTVLIVVVALVLFLSVIMIHEFGHFIFAKSFGVKVNEFSIGMGPKLLSKQKGDTVYSLRALPIGGYCAMEGEDEDSDDERSFQKRKVWQKIIIVAAGAIFNIILGLIFMLIIQAQQPYYASRTIANFLPTLVSESDVRSDKSTVKYYYSEDGDTYYEINKLSSEGINEEAGTVGYLSVKGSENGHFFREATSGRSGLREGDQIYSVDGYRAFCFYDAYFIMSLDEDGVMDFDVIRDGEHKIIKDVTFDRIAGTGAYSGTDITVLDFQVYGVQRTFRTLMQSTFLQSQYFVRSVYVSLWRIITGRVGFSQMSGPVGIASMIGEVAQEGFAQSFADGINNILYLMALITFNLGIVNLLPLPALDGGRLVFLVIEAIRRKPIPPEREGMVHFIGIILLFGLMILITFNDIMKLISSCGG